MNNVFISIGTSLIVSNITFILGLKAGKNQTDRQVIRERYKVLYRHFNELSLGLNSTNPKRWDDFKEVKLDTNRTKHIPVVNDMILNGDMAEFNIKFVERLKALEEEILKYSSYYNNYFSILEERLLTNLEKNCDNIEESTYDIKTRKDTIGYGCFTEKIGILILESELDDLIKLLDSHKKSGVTFKLRNNKNLYIYNDTLNDITLSDFLKGCYNENIKDIEVTKLINSKEKLLKEINQVMKEINKRIKEPFPFWKTFFGAFADLFKS